MSEVAVLKNRKVGLLLLAIGAAWLMLTVAVQIESFGIARYLGWSFAASLAQQILGYLNSWWGFAAAVATAAAFGLSWTVVLIKAMLQKVGMKFALQYASAL